MGILARRLDQLFPDQSYVAPVGHTHWDAKAYLWITVGPVRHGRVDKLLVRDNRRDVVVRDDHSTACANFRHLSGHARDLHSISNGDWSLRQNDQAADKVARDVLQTKTDADADRARENGQRLEMNAGVLQDNEDADDEDDVRCDLRDGVLQRAIKPAVDEKAVKKKSLGARRNPKDDDQQSDEEENLQQANRDAGQGRAPGEGDAETVDRADKKENQRRQAQDSGDDGGEVAVDFETAEQPPHKAALEELSHDQSERDQAEKGDEAKDRNLVTREIKDRVVKPRNIHAG